MIGRLRAWRIRFGLSHTRAWYTGWSWAGPIIVCLIAGVVLGLVLGGR